MERLLISCERAGITRVFLETPPERRNELAASLGRFRDDPRVVMVERLKLDDLRAQRGFDPAAPSVWFSGNLVFLKSQLTRVLESHASSPRVVQRFASSDPDRGGEIATGPLAALLAEDGLRAAPLRPAAGALPFALNGRPEDRDEAELRLAREVRHESAATDAALARLVDRNLSWRISYRLARTAITPNQVTIANTLVGFAAAWMFAIPGYWWPLLGSLLFLFSITVDGVDGELARLKMTESSFGGKLDVFTDNLVHVAIFAGVYTGVYRATHDHTFLYLLALQLGGFGLAAIATWLAFSMRGKVAEQWLQRVDRWTGRDFAYLLVGFALLGKLSWFCWGTAFGTYLFSLTLMWLTARRRGRAVET